MTSTQVSVNLAFTANVEQAKQQLQSLQTQLNNITMGKNIGTEITQDLQGAIKAATELQVHLKNATNVNTGNLDFAKFNQSIKSSGMSLEQYGAKLRSLGPTGQQAFMSLANSVASAEIPLRRSHKLLQSFGTTLANTAKWQLSSSMLHGFMSATQAAYGYAQDLNESLNNIRIVTGQNIDQMAKFAQEANNAAKALSTTTTEYTNASLIYYQQGLNDQQVKERTDITIKMANVARQSAEVVSDQMTAVWNNFYDGSKSLEHYADVMTALGAATASSTDEIAGGLEKFAAIGNTIGLSFEYAASALATITSNTRQSEEVVGTALKTVFARIQGLTLGETLEDGTNLNKYSEALDKVGISIYDSAGELKNMDNILDEMAAKWDKLSKAQQAALAQTVAGIRQYTQLIALMENWDNGDSDSMIANLATSAGSAGALQEQADIYAESWEGARDRVTAAAEEIYSSLINDEDFIDLLNGVEKVLGFVDDLIDSLGGLKGVLMAIGTIVTKVFSQQLAQGLSTMAYNIKMSTQAGRDAANAERVQFIDKAVNSIAQHPDYDDPTITAQQDSMRSQLTLQKEMLTNAEKMSTYEFERNKMLLDRNKLMQENIVIATKEKQQADNSVDQSKYNLQSRIYSGGGSKVDQEKSVQELNHHIDNIRQDSKTVSDISTAFDKFSNGVAKGKKEVTELQKSIASLKTGDHNVQALIDRFAQLDLNADNAEQEVKELIAQIKALTNQSAKNIKNLIPVDGNDAQEQKQVRQEVDNLVASIDQQTSAENKRSAAVREGANAHKLASSAIHESIGAQKGWSDIVVEGANVAFSAAMSFQMLSSMIDTLNSPDVSGWEKFSSVLMTLGMTIPMLISVWGTLKSLISAETVAKIANVAATIAQTYAERSLKNAKNDSADAINNSRNATNTDTKRKLGQRVKDKGRNLKDTWNRSAFEKQGGTLHKNGTSSIPGRQGLVSKQETSQLMSQAGKTAGKALLKSAGSALVIAASVAAAGAIIKTAIDHYNRFEIEAEKAKEVAQSISAVYDEVKTRETEFRNTMESYDSGVEGLDKLTKGTEEYRDAVRAANDEAVKLINSYDNLSYTINEDGLIVIDAASKAAAKQQSLLNEAVAFSAKMHAQQDADTAQVEADKVEFQRTQMKAGGAHWDNDDTTAVAGGVGAGAALGVGAAVAFANAWNPVGWAMIIAGALATVIGVGIAAFNNDADARESQTLQALEEFSTQNGGRDLTKDEITEIANKQDPSGKLAASLLEDVNATNEMISEMRTNTEAINRNNELIANQIAQNNPQVAASEHYNDIIEASGLYEGQAYQAALARITADKWGTEGISKATKVNDQAELVWSQYLEAAGLQGLELVDTTGDDKNRIFVYLDEQGNRQEKTLDEMIKTRAAYEAALETNGNMNQLVSLFAEWSKKEAPSDQAFTSFLLNGNFEDSTKSESDAIKNVIKDEYDGDISAYLTSQLGNLDEAAKKLGYSGADALVSAFTNAINNMDTSWADINFDNWDTDVQKNVKGADAKSINNIAATMTGGSNKQGDVLFTTGINDLIKDLKPEVQEEALTRLANIDWTQWNAGWQAVDILKALGQEVDLSDGKFANWVMEVNKASGATFDYASAVANLNKMQELSNNLEFNSIISQEDYDLLVKYNGEVAKYFRLLGDGTYKMTGDPLDARQAIGEGIDASYQEAIDGAQANYDHAIDRQMTDNQVKATGYSRDSLATTAWGQTGTKTTYTQNKANFGHYALAFLGEWGENASGVQDGVDFVTNAKNMAGTTEHKEAVMGIANKDLYNAQIDFIDQHLNGYTDEQIAKWRAATDEASVNEVASVISKHLEQYKAITADEVTGYSTELQDLQKQKLGAEIEYATSAESSKQLNKMYEEGQIGAQAFNTAAMEFATQEKWEGMDPAEVEDYADSLMNAAEASDLLSDELKDNEEAAEDVALYTKKMNQGIDKLAKGIEDWSDVLKKSDKSSEEYSEAMQGMKDAMSDVLGVSEDFLSDDFIIQNMKDIELAAKGDAEAINRLALAAAKDILVNVEFDSEEAKNKAITLHNELAGLVPDIEVGATLSDGDFLSKAQEIIETAGMTADQANAYFRSMGFEAKFKTEPQTVTQRVPITYTKQSIVDKGVDEETGASYYTTATSSWQDGYEEFEGEMDVIAMSTNGETPVIESITRTNSGSMNNYSSSNPGGPPPGGGGGSKEPNKVEAKKKDDIVERYKETEDAIDDVRDAYEDASKAADRLYGASRIAAMMKANKELKKETELLKQKRKEAEAYLKLDKVALNKAAADVGVNLKYDENGNIINYTEELDRLATEHEQKAAELNAKPGGPSDEEVEKFEEEKEKIDELTAAMEKYEDTRQTIRDTDNAIRDNDYEWQDNNYEMWSHSLEVSLDITGDAKELLDALLSRTEGDFYRQAEGLGIMYGQLALTNTEMGIYIGHLGMLGGLMATDSISPEKFIEGLNQIQQGAMNAAAALYELDQQMIEYYGNALNMAREEIDIYTDRMEHCTSVLEHYLSLLELMGQQQDYRSRGVILAGRVETLANELDAIQEEADYMMQEAESKKRLLDTVGLIPGAADVLKQQYEDALSAASDTQEEFLSKAEEYAEALNAQLENTLKQYGQELENALTGGKGFELLTTEMEHMVSLQEDYLTETNKIYETEKLMNKAQQDIDKSTNTVAKRKLKQFIEETNLLKQKTDLSQFELDIQQAKYELLLAEIALEEAQMSKSQVRLKRDAEGNFGYVYTAEAETVANAEQEYFDKQNELYNIALDGINTYAEKHIQTKQEMYDTLSSIDEKYRNGEYASWEAYQAARAEAMDYYSKKIQQTSEIFNIALQQDTNATADAWGSDYADMIDFSDEWKAAVTSHASKVNSAFQTWGTTMDVLAQRVGVSMEQLAGSVGKVTNESDALLQKLTAPGGVLDQIKVEMGLVSALTTLYASLRWAVMAAAAAYTALATALMLVSAASAMAAGVGAILDSDAVKGATDAVGDAISDAASKSSSGTKSSNSSGSSTKSSGYGAGDSVKFTGSYTADSYGGGNSGSLYQGQEVVISHTNEGAKNAYHLTTKDGKPLGWVSGNQISRFNTGGYTGEWGSYGKLAMLDEKELVLNADDTKNFLASMDLLDSIVSTIDLHAANQQLGGILSSPGMSDIGGDTLEQTVTIEANFPNVSSRIEIEEAFSTLVNRASQYANRK